MHVVVLTRVAMRKLAFKRLQQVVQHATRREGKELAGEPTAGDVERQVQKTVEHQQPHGREMPLQRTAQPTTEGDDGWYGKGKDRRCVIDTPAAHHHDHHGQGIEPVRDAHPQRMNGPSGQIHRACLDSFWGDDGAGHGAHCWTGPMADVSRKVQLIVITKKRLSRENGPLWTPLNAY